MLTEGKIRTNIKRITSALRPTKAPPAIDYKKANEDLRALHNLPLPERYIKFIEILDGIDPELSYYLKRENNAYPS